MSISISGFKGFKNTSSGSNTGGNQSPKILVEGLPPNMNKPSNAIIIEGSDRVQNNNNNGGINSSGN